MEEMPNEGNIASPQDSQRKPRRLRPVLVALAAVVLLFAGYVLWLAFLSPEAVSEFEARKNLELFQNFQKTYETAMRNDAYGGRTPQETLDLFIDALKKGDIDLASKYFVLKENGEVDQKWITNLNELKNKEGLAYLYETLSKAEPYPKDINSSEDYKFIVVDNSTGELSAYINLEINKYSGVWKIESL